MIDRMIDRVRKQAIGLGLNWVFVWGVSADVSIGLADGDDARRLGADIAGFAWCG